MLTQASKLIVCALILWCGSCAKQSSSEAITLTRLSSWASNLDEYPAPDNADLLNPDYGGFYEAIRSSHSTTMDYFLRLLGDAVKMRKMNKGNMRYILAMRAAPKTRIFVWGDLQGAFHSLVRDLEELKRRGAIDDNLKIQNDDTYFVFNGNQIDRSAHNIETLTAILSLMKNNPNQAIYIAGRHELNNVWRDHAMQRELNVRLGFLKKTDVAPQTKLLQAFFDSLPLELLVVDSTSEALHALGIFGHENSVNVPMHLLVGEIEQVPEGRPSAIQLEGKHRKASKKLIMEAALRAVTRSATYRVTDGLEIIEPENGAISWTSLSSPTLSYQTLFDFANDAFVELTIHESLRKSSITLHKQNAKKRNGFTANAFHLLSGRELSLDDIESPPTAGDFPIAFGTTIDLSGGSRILGQRIMSGVDMRFRKANRTNAIPGQIFRLYLSDDRSSPSIALKNVIQMNENFGVRVLVAPVGTMTLDALLPEAKKGKITLFFPTSGSPSLRDPTLKTVINLRPSVTEEACALARHARSVLYQNKFAFFYENNEFGRQPYRAAKDLLKRFGVPGKNICKVPYEPNSLNMEDTAKQVLACAPDAIFLFSNLVNAQALIHELGVPFLSKTTLFGLSTMTDALRSYTENSDSISKGLHIVIARVVPNPMDTSLEIVRKYIAEMNENYPGAHHNVDSLEAYIDTSLIVHTIQGLRTPVTVENIMKRLESLRNYNHQGLTLTFDPKTRTLSDHLWLDTGNGDWIKQKPARTLCR